MNIQRTLEGGLRLDLENAGDWQLLAAITNDAISCDEKLARRLGNLITDEDVAPDWNEYVVPDLEDGFSSDVQHVATLIALARLECGGGKGPLWIIPNDALRWYSTLNQARLALEETYRFGATEDVDLVTLPFTHRAVFIRSRFYCDLQILLLNHVMR